MELHFFSIFFLFQFLYPFNGKALTTEMKFRTNKFLADPPSLADPIHLLFCFYPFALTLTNVTWYSQLFYGHWAFEFIIYWNLDFRVFGCLWLCFLIRSLIFRNYSSAYILHSAPELHKETFQSIKMCGNFKVTLKNDSIFSTKGEIANSKNFVKNINRTLKLLWKFGKNWT